MPPATTGAGLAASTDVKQYIATVLDVDWLAMKGHDGEAAIDRAGDHTLAADVPVSRGGDRLRQALRRCIKQGAGLKKELIEEAKEAGV